MAGETVLLIHGMWMTPKSWQPWVDRFSERGHRTIAEGWPGIDREPEEIRRDPSALRGLGLDAIVAHYERLIGDLEGPPIIIGHSFGGLVTQLLLDRGHGAAGVAIGTAPPKGILVLPPSTLRSGLPGLKNPFDRNGLAPLTPDQFRWRFTNTLGPEESQAIYDAQYIPGTNRAFFEAAYAALSRRSPAALRFDNPNRAPLLLVVGELDHISPPALNGKLLKLQSRAPSKTESREYSGRTHYMAGMDGWEQIADESLEWALANART
jgi:pimeloyl-ACP methyl ester carboxylesterase